MVSPHAPHGITHIPTYITNMNRISQCTTRYTHTHNNTNCAHIQQTDPESIIYMKLQAKLLAITSAKTYPSFKDTTFQFAMTKDTAEHNSQLLSKYNYNLEETLAAGLNDPPKVRRRYISAHIVVEHMHFIAVPALRCILLYADAKSNLHIRIWMVGCAHHIAWIMWIILMNMKP